MVSVQMKAGDNPADNRQFFKNRVIYALQDGSLLKGIERAKLGDVITLELKVVKPQRTLPQNAQFHRLVQILAEESGYTFDEAKFYLKSRAVSKGYPQEEKNGKKLFLMNQPKGKPTHLATKTEMSILIDFSIDILARDFGVSPEVLYEGYDGLK